MHRAKILERSKKLKEDINSLFQNREIINPGRLKNCRDFYIQVGNLNMIKDSGITIINFENLGIVHWLCWQ